MILKKIHIHRFFGFDDFEADFGELSVLTGPNNGGKTSILRAIKFGTDAFRQAFGGGAEPSPARIKKIPLKINAQQAFQQLGFSDLTYLFSGRSKLQDGKLTLRWGADDGETIVDVSYQADQDAFYVNWSHEGSSDVGSDIDIAPHIVNRLYSHGVQFVPPVATISPDERPLDWHRLQEQLAQGKYAETWRNQLHWLNDGKPGEFFQRLTETVRRYFPNVHLNPPSRTKAEPTMVTVTYVEDHVEYDIAASGGGIRTLVTLAAAIELSGAAVLLLDEPDAHLHSSLQRQVARFLYDQASNDRQVILSTHSPDMIDEFPLESLTWIDRESPRGRKCNDVGKTLVDLGAVTNAHAIQYLGADVLLFCEDKPDRKAFEAILTRCGKNELCTRCRFELLGGFGDATHVPGAMRVLRALLPMNVAAAVIRDSDYTATKEPVRIELVDEVLMAWLPCKELENLLLMDAKTILGAAQQAAEERRRASSDAVELPTLEEIESKIDACSQEPAIRDSIRPQWLFRRYKSRGLGDPGLVRDAEREFEDRWHDPEWRRRWCPGKAILKGVARWLQGQPYKITLTLQRLFAAYEPPPDVQQLFDKLESHVAKATGERSVDRKQPSRSRATR